MATDFLPRLIALIASSDNNEVRLAAVRVAGALKPIKERALHQALLDTLKEDDAALRLLAIQALGELHADEALPRLIQLIETGDAEVEVVVRAIGQLGARGTKALGQVMHQANPVLRRRIVAALALVGTESAVLATAESLRDEDPRVVEASAKSLATELPSLTAAQKRTLAEHLMEMLEPASQNRKEAKKSKKAAVPPSNLAPVSEAAMMRVLAALHAPEAEEIYWAHLDPERPAPMRSAALQALAALPLPNSEAKLQKLLSCAASADFQIVAPALMLLKKVPANRKNVKHWLGLLEAPDVAAHLLAVEKLREVDSDAVAEALLKQLHHPDKALRDAALAALGELKAGRAALFDGLLEAQDADEAWTLGRAQVQAARAWTSAERAKVFDKACKLFEREDRRADALWFLLREIDGQTLRDQLGERALALRKKKNFAASLTYWRLLTRDPAVGAELRFELAATALKLSNHDTSAAAREADQTLNQFSRLLQEPAFDLIGHVRAAKWLDEEDLFYLGFHFAEQPRLAREFGGAVLKLVMERSPKSALGKNARQKLKSEGL